MIHMEQKEDKTMKDMILTILAIGQAALLVLLLMALPGAYRAEARRAEAERKQ